jgi:hypothetical protein
MVAGVAVVISVAAVTAMTTASRTKHPIAPVDTRPLGLPAAIDGIPRATKPSGQLYDISNRHWAAGYHGSSFETALYGKDPAMVILIAGRGPIGHAVAVDLGPTAPEHRVFGDVTCADFLYTGPDVSPTLRHDQDDPAQDICWYSSPTFSVAIAFSRTDDDSEGHAAALDAVLPILENNVP